MSRFLALATLLLLAGCTGCNHLTDPDVIYGPYSTFPWLP